MSEPAFATEADLAAPVVAWLNRYEWEVYQEVQLRRGGPVADLVAVRGSIVWAMESKKSLSLALLEQAHGWRPLAHYVSIITPRARREPRGYRFAAEALRLTGMGWLEVGAGRGVPAVAERVKAHVYRQARTADLLARLDERQKTYAPAGTAGSKRWTPFQKTCEGLRLAAAAEPGILLTEAIARTEHHYKTAAAARSTLAQWFKQGVITGVHVRKVEGRLRLYPDVGWVATDSQDPRQKKVAN